MKFTPSFFNSLIGCSLVVLVAGCGGGGSGGSTGTVAGGTGNGDTSANTGTSAGSSISISLTDAPVDAATHVVVEFTGITLKPESGSQIDIDFAEPRQIDLLALQGNVSTMIVEDEPVPAGAYNWMRLKVNTDCDVATSYVELNDGGVYPLYVPSGSQTGLKLNKGFEVDEDGGSEFTIDFDLRKSVHKPNGRGCYFLKPSLRLVASAQAGSLAGIVDPALLADEMCTDEDGLRLGNAVYVYEGNDVTPDDIDGSEPEPVTTAGIVLNEETIEFEYTAGFLPAGDYTVAFTCQAGNDEPDSDDAITFVAPANVTVESGQNTVHDIVLP